MRIFLPYHSYYHVYTHTTYRHNLPRPIRAETGFSRPPAPTHIHPECSPIGPFVIQDTYSADELARLIDIIETSPTAYRQLVEDLSPTDLAKTYREGSWIVQQLVHHVADMQLLHYLRMKKALTETDYAEVTMIDMNGWAATFSCK